jgi:hypothetical protein
MVVTAERADHVDEHRWPDSEAQAMSEPITTVPWYPELALLTRPETPGSAVRLLLLVDQLAGDLDCPLDGVLIGALIACTGVREDHAVKALWLAVHLGIVQATHVTTTVRGQA